MVIGEEKVVVVVGDICWMVPVRLVNHGDGEKRGKETRRPSSMQEKERGNYRGMGRR